jgi:hypothetical protein
VSVPLPILPDRGVRKTMEDLAPFLSLTPIREVGAGSQSGLRNVPFLAFLTSL